MCISADILTETFIQIFSDKTHIAMRNITRSENLLYIYECELHT